MTLKVAHNVAHDHVATMATGKVLGRQTAGVGPVEEIDIASLGGGVLENRTDDPVAPATGRIWLRTDL
jgi:hypothetical protein